MAKSNFGKNAVEIVIKISTFEMAILQTIMDFDKISFIGTVSSNYCQKIKLRGKPMSYVATAAVNARSFSIARNLYNKWIFEYNLSRRSN